MDPLTAVKFAAFLALLVVAASWDIKERRIPNTVTVTGLGAALMVGAFLEGGIPMLALAGAGIALLIGLLSMISTTGTPAFSSIAAAAGVCSRPAMITPDGRQDSISYSTASSRSGESKVTKRRSCRPQASGSRAPR